MASWLGTAILLMILLAASIADVRSRTVPMWLTVGAVGSCLVSAAFAGSGAVWQALIGLGVGGALLLPAVLLGWFGSADAFLLAAIGGWEGWHF
ncbi:MAG: prepilin peptidase, partial [Chloroflexota bacterium]|nr:prepilin peptidase [Chloroflexota bacterium]